MNAKNMFGPEPYSAFGKTDEQIKNAREPIVFIEYQLHKDKWYPRSVETTLSTYDFDLTVDGDLIYHESGGGDNTGNRQLYCGEPSTEITSTVWYDPEHVAIFIGKKQVTVESQDEAKSLGTMIVSKPILYTKTHHGNPFEWDIARSVEEGVLYCQQCKGNVPGDEPCRHIKFEECVGWTLGCGAPECNYHKAQTSLYRLLRLLPDKAIQNLADSLASPSLFIQTIDSMLGGNHQLTISPCGPTIYCEPLGTEIRYEERYYPGIAWLHSLDLDCNEAVALTRGWVWQWQKQSWRAQCVVPESSLRKVVSDAFLNQFYRDKPDFKNNPLIIDLPKIKRDSANSIAFVENPKNCNEVWLTDGRKRKTRDVVLSVANVEVNKKSGKVCIHFGRVLTRDGLHCSEFKNGPGLV